MDKMNAELANRLAFWESLFPGKGVGFMDILGPLCGWKPGFKNALPDLEECARRAVFWRGMKGVRAFRAVAGAVFSEMSFGGLEFPGFRSCDHGIGTDVWERFDEALEAQTEGLKEAFWDACESVLSKGERNPWMEEILYGSLILSIDRPCCFVLVGKPDEAAKFKPLLDLWLAGNFPLGFDEEGNLLVLVAD